MTLRQKANAQMVGDGTQLVCPYLPAPSVLWRARQCGDEIERGGRATKSTTRNNKWPFNWPASIPFPWQALQQAKSASYFGDATIPAASKSNI